MEPPRILIVDDHALLVEALAAAFRSHGIPDVERADVDGGSDLETVLRHADSFGPELALVDIHLGGDRLGIPLVAPLAERGVCVLVMTASRDPLLLGASIDAGAAGILDKSQPFGELLRMIEAARAGAPVLSPALRDTLLARAGAERREREAQLSPFRAITPREVEVLDSLLEGRTADDIAELYGMALATVRTHIRSILSKLGVNTQLAAVAMARRAGWSPSAAAE